MARTKRRTAKSFGPQEVAQKGGDMQVWKITREGMGGILYVRSLDVFEDNQGPAADYELGERFTMEIIEMPERIFVTLPEFECFE